MTTKGVIALDTKIYIGDEDSPAGLQLIAEPKDISGPQIAQEFADLTHQQSTGGFRERKPTFKTSGDVTFRCNYISDDPAQELLISAAQAHPAVAKYFKMEFPDESVITFFAYVSVRFMNPMAGAEEIEVTLSLEGAFDLEPGA